VVVVARHVDGGTISSITRLTTMPVRYHPIQFESGIP